MCLRRGVLAGASEILQVAGPPTCLPAIYLGSNACEAIRLAPVSLSLLARARGKRRGWPESRHATLSHTTQGRFMGCPLAGTSNRYHPKDYDAVQAEAIGAVSTLHMKLYPTVPDCTVKNGEVLHGRLRPEAVLSRRGITIWRSDGTWCVGLGPLKCLLDHFPPDPWKCNGTLRVETKLILRYPFENEDSHLSERRGQNARPVREIMPTSQIQMHGIKSTTLAIIFTFPHYMALLPYALGH